MQAGLPRLRLHRKLRGCILERGRTAPSAEPGRATAARQGVAIAPAVFRGAMLLRPGRFTVILSQALEAKVLAALLSLSQPQAKMDGKG